MIENERKKLIDLVEHLFLCKGKEISEKMCIAWCKELKQYELEKVKKAIRKEIDFGDGFLNLSDLHKELREKVMDKAECERRIRGY